MDAAIWLARILRHAQSSAAFADAVHVLAEAEGKTPSFDADALILEHSGRQLVWIDDPVDWLGVSAPSVPSNLRVRVTNALAERIAHQVSLGLERGRQRMEERFASARSRLRLADLDLRHAIEASGRTELALGLEHDRLVALREELGAIENEHELSSLDADDEAAQAKVTARIARVRSKIQDVDRRLQALVTAAASIDEARAARNRLQDLVAAVAAEMEDLELERLFERPATIIERASDDS